MARFQVWYTEETTYKAYFEADSLEQAEELLEQVQRGETFTEELPEFHSKIKESGLYVGMDTLEELPEVKED
jgi:hypothetical protein